MFNGLKSWFKNSKLQNKVALVYLFVTGIICVISIIALQASFNIYDKKLYEKSLQELDYFIQEVNDGLDQVENLSYSLAMNNEVQAYLTNVYDIGKVSPDYYYELSHLRSILQDSINTHPIVKNIIYLNHIGVKLMVGIDCGPIDENEYLELMEAYGSSRGGYVFRSPTEEYPYLLSGRDILERKNASLNYLGSFILTSDVAGLIKQKKNELEAPNSTLLVYSAENIIYTELDENENTEFSLFEDHQGYDVVTRQGQKYFLCYLTSSRNGWTYVNYVPYSEIFGQTMAVRYLMLASFLLIFVMAVFILRKVARIITNPLKQLTEAMQYIEDGDFQGAKEYLPKEQRNDEVGLLAQEFVDMMDKIDTLIFENYEKQILLKDTKYKMLQAQINPHFLYNTLNTLNWLVRAGRNEEAGKMTVELGMLLRATFAKELYTNVEQEVAELKSYVTIQQFRYHSRAEFTIHTEGNLKDYMVPHMILQPLVENAIYYGVEKSLNTCHISVLVKEETDTILLKVKDDGPGMYPEELNAVRNFTIKPKGHGIGLKNIQERLNIAYQHSEFIITSEPGTGTQISLRIPKQKKRGGRTCINF